VLEGDIWTPKNYQGGQEQDPDVADLISRLRTLTPQQSRVLGMLGEGLLNKQIAYELSVSEATIKAHVSAILLKLKVDSRTQAVIQLGKINMAMVA
jgi:DNA-binding NarL/FixJ family response regulator